MIRYALATPDARSGARFTDVIGTLVEASPEQLVVDAAAGRVSVPRSAVVATRVIPPRPTRRGAPHRALSVEDLERVMVGAWPPAERDRLGGWILRAAGGFTARANSALVVGHPDQPLPAALETVTQWYAARGLTPILALPGGPGQHLTDDPVAAAALASGWVCGEPVLVMTAATRSLVVATAAADIEIQVSDRGSTAWFDTYVRSREVRREAAEIVLHGSPAQRFGIARSRDGSVLGIGRLGVSDGWGGLGAMWVEPASRGRGIGQALIQALSAEATAHGCVSTHLQVDSANAGAISLYEKVGFTTHHTYAYLERRA